MKPKKVRRKVKGFLRYLKNAVSKTSKPKRKRQNTMIAQQSSLAFQKVLSARIHESQRRLYLSRNQILKTVKMRSSPE